MAFVASFGQSMENKKSDDQNGDGNPEKPENSIFHPIYSCNQPVCGYLCRLKID
jgi:hypothetical protein